MMPSIEQTERFLSECVLYRTALKCGDGISAEQRLLVKMKLYELIFDLEATKSAQTNSFSEDGSLAARPHKRAG